MVMRSVTMCKRQAASAAAAAAAARTWRLGPGCCHSPKYLYHMLSNCRALPSPYTQGPSLPSFPRVPCPPGLCFVVRGSASSIIAPHFRGLTKRCPTRCGRGARRSRPPRQLSQDRPAPGPVHMRAPFVPVDHSERAATAAYVQGAPRGLAGSLYWRVWCPCLPCLVPGHLDPPSGFVLHVDPCPQCHAAPSAKLDVRTSRMAAPFCGAIAVQVCQVCVHPPHGPWVCAAPKATAGRWLAVRAAYLKHPDHPCSAAILQRAPQVMGGKRVVPL